MVPKTAYPPTHHHTTTTLPPGTAENKLSLFLTATQTTPHLHPDSQLSSTRITFSSISGPTGGLALHHLARIAAGLRGENLLLESEEELARFFAENHLREGDDGKLDGLIAAKMGKGRRERKREAIEEWAEESSALGEGEGEVESFVNTPRFSPEAVEGRGERERLARRAAKRARRLAVRREKARGE